MLIWALALVVLVALVIASCVLIELVMEDEWARTRSLMDTAVAALPIALIPTAVLLAAAVMSSLTSS
jgi:hypothetical protein